METLDDDTKAELYEIFKIFDMDLNGFIDLKEIEQLLHSLNLPYNTETIQRKVKRVDADGNGYMSFDEFCVFMLSSKPADKDKELRQIFALVDLDQNGLIDREELRKLLVNVGRMQLTEEDLDDMFSVIDNGNTGQVKYEDFKSFFQDLL